MHGGYRFTSIKGKRPRGLHGQHGQHSGAGSAGGGELAAVPKSAARLAAEAAFETPAAQPSTTPLTQITVRKRRSTDLSTEPAPGLALAAVDVDRPLGDLASTGPRTFRVDAAKAVAADDPARPVEAAADAGDPAPAERWNRRARRAHHQRPGPVTHTVVELPSRPVETSVQRLKADLAEVGPVLDSIRLAQDTVFIDGAADTAWQELSARVDALSLEVQLQLMQAA